MRELLCLTLRRIDSQVNGILRRSGNLKLGQEIFFFLRGGFLSLLNGLLKAYSLVSQQRLPSGLEFISPFVDLDTEIARAPWDTMEMPLAQRMLEMANHLQQHKGQLFYYLKLQGKPVDTMHLWGV